MADCGKCGMAELEQYLTMPNPLTGSYDYETRCEPCAVASWPCSVHFVWGFGIPEEVKARFLTLKMLERLRQWDVPTRTKPVYVFHRRETESTYWLSRWDQRAQYCRPGAPYGYRGWCSYDHILLLWDETETPDSMEWLLYHELGHVACSRAKMFDMAMSRENEIEGRTAYAWQDDEAHEEDSEERLVNRVATAHMDGIERARPWWRPRVIGFQRGYSVLPDAFAPGGSPEFEMFRFAVAEGWTARRKDGSMLPIHGYDYGKLGADSNPTAFSEDARKAPDFRAKLVETLNPRPPVVSETLADPEE